MSLPGFLRYLIHLTIYRSIIAQLLILNVREVQCQVKQAYLKLVLLMTYHSRW